MIKEIYKKIVPERLRYNIKLLKRELSYPFYIGNNFYCNCCNKSFRKFLKKGYIVRHNAECPYCGSLERNRLLLLYFTNTKILESKQISLLHFAPENCLKSILTAKSNIHYVDVDINPIHASMQADITNLPFKNNTFDYIICSHVLGHVPDQQKALEELYRVLKPKGVAFIMTLIDKNLKITFEDKSIQDVPTRILKYGEHDLVRRHGRDFIDNIKSVGFYVKELNYAETLDPAIRKRYSLGNGERELIFYGAKSENI